MNLIALLNINTIVCLLHVAPIITTDDRDDMLLLLLSNQNYYHYIQKLYIYIYIYIYVFLTTKCTYMLSILSLLLL